MFSINSFHKGESMDTNEKLIDKLLYDNEIALVPHNPNPTEELKTLFDYFNTAHRDLLYKSIIDKHNHTNDENFEFALNTIKHYKGMFDGFDTQIEFNLYQKIKPWLSENARKQFRVHYYRDYGKALLNDDIFELDDGLLHLILTNDIPLFIKIAKKLKIHDAGKKIFEQNQLAIYDWLNECDDVYAELIKLNDPKFIFQNMNGRLNASDGSLRYVIENTEPSKDLFISIKRNIGLKKLWELSNGKLKDIFFVELVETLEDLIFVINTPDIELKTIETILKTTKERFPNIYESLNSLLFVKKEFNNK